MVQFVILVTQLVPLVLFLTLITCVVLVQQDLMSKLVNLKTLMLLVLTELVYNLVQLEPSKTLLSLHIDVLNVTNLVLVALLMLTLVVLVLKVSISMEPIVSLHVHPDIGLIPLT